jgi:enolase
LDVGVVCYGLLKKALTAQGYSTDVGDEGGFAPEKFNPQKSLDLIRKAVSAKYTPGKDVFFGMDVAAGSFYKGDLYAIEEQHLNLSSDKLSDYYEDLLCKFEIIYLEDPFYEKDHAAWASFYKKFYKRLMISADDLVVTNPYILDKIIDEKLANTVIVKPNQVGTLTETLAFIRKAKENKMTLCVSHRSGDTAEDTFIADLAVAVGAEFMKSGAPARGERVAKYNRLLEIWEYEKHNSAARR